MFAPAWRDRTAEDDAGAPFFNDTQKFVVGSEPLVEEWANTTLLGAYDPDVIRKLKAERDGLVYVSGSGRLVRGLLALLAQDVYDNGVAHLSYGRDERVDR